MKRAASIVLALSCTALAACNGDPELLLDYELVDVQPAEIARVETVIAVAGSDGTSFADAGAHQIARGIDAAVRADAAGAVLVITHDGALGWTPSNHFRYRLMSPAHGAAPPLVVSARALDAAGNAIARFVATPAQLGFNAQLSIRLVDQRCGGVLCASGQACCGAVCVDVSSDVDRCGACDTPCSAAGNTCQSGICRCAGGSACAPGQLCCASGCVDFVSDPFNCGGCGLICNAGETCDAGRCRCGAGSPCGLGEACCSDGACSATGVCPCGAGSCRTPSVCCDAASASCANLGADSASCGTCGEACSAPYACSHGSCACHGSVCAIGDVCCGAGCRSLSDDPLHCGDCDHACQAGERCVAGACTCGDGATAQACGPGRACCAGACLDVAADTANCGACGVTCNPGEHCVDGNCSCGGGRACSSAERCCNDSCVDLTSSHDHCGVCSGACDADTTCVKGQCTGVPCTANCTNANQCVGSACVCGGGPPCADPLTCCGASCTNLLTDVTTCGNCATRCKSGEVCNGGTCTCNGGPGCGGSETCCAEIGCALPGTTTMACGPCRVPCSPGETCTAGVCRCSATAFNCGAISGYVIPACCSGVCADLYSSLTHCGQCGVDCTGGGCYGGLCR